MSPAAKARFLLARQRQRQRHRKESQLTLLAQQTGLSTDLTDRQITDFNQIM